MQTLSVSHFINDLKSTTSIVNGKWSTMGWTRPEISAENQAR